MKTLSRARTSIYWTPRTLVKRTAFRSDPTAVSTPGPATRERVATCRAARLSARHGGHGTQLSPETKPARARSRRWSRQNGTKLHGIPVDERDVPLPDRFRPARGGLNRRPDRLAATLQPEAHRKSRHRSRPEPAEVGPRSTRTRHRRDRRSSLRSRPAIARLAPVRSLHRRSGTTPDTSSADSSARHV